MILLKRIIYSIPMKVSAVALSVITVVAAVLSALGIYVMFDMGGYTKSREDTQLYLLRNFARSDAYDIGQHVVDGVLGESTHDIYADTNITYTVLNAAGEVLGETYKDEAVWSSVTEEVETDRYVTKVTDYGIEYETTESAGTVTVIVYIPEEMHQLDKYYYADKYVGKLWDIRVALFWIAGISVLLSIALWIYLICAAGRTAPYGEFKKSPIDRIPFDICLAGAVALSMFGIYWATDVLYGSDIFTVVILGAVVLVVYLMAVAVLMSFSSRVKQGILIKETLIFRVLHLLLRGLKWLVSRIGYILRNIPFVWKSALITAITAILCLIFTVPVCWYERDVHFLIWIIGSIIVVPVVLYIAIILNRLKSGGEKIASGDLDFKIDTTYMFGDFKRFGESLNHINDGIRAAVDKSMRSERMKTELITNVSHDIKTPLTSIINYVDLIKKQDTQNEQTQEYIAVLDRQSTRLKKLIEDLVEASKASTGNLSVELAPCDASVLLSQAVGEFDERLKEKNLQVMLGIPEERVTVIADGRRLWRVFDNLMNNICKYALEGTRVYLDLRSENGRVYITFRNISKYPLNISGEELTERFVRGDRSRHTEGSGLGLSIAKSLVELQNGSLDILIDGDLFKVIITFGEVK